MVIERSKKSARMNQEASFPRFFSQWNGTDLCFTTNIINLEGLEFFSPSDSRRYKICIPLWHCFDIGQAVSEEKRFEYYGNIHCTMYIVLW